MTTKVLIILALCALVAAGSVAAGWRKAGSPAPMYGTCDNCHETTIVDFRINAPVHAPSGSITCAPHVERMQRMMLGGKIVGVRDREQFERDVTGRW